MRTQTQLSIHLSISRFFPEIDICGEECKKELICSFVGCVTSSEVIYNAARALANTKQSWRSRPLSNPKIRPAFHASPAPHIIFGVTSKAGNVIIESSTKLAEK